MGFLEKISMQYNSDLQEVHNQQIELFANKVKIKILDYLRSKGISNINVIESNLNNIKAIYVGTIGEMFCTTDKEDGKHVIVIDKKYIEFDDKGNIIGFDENIIKLIESQLGHEMIHVAAKDASFLTGLMRVNINNRGLNEGFTQMLAEEIFDYTVSPHSDGYRECKKISKILLATFGEKFILETYFNEPEQLERVCNKLARENSFYTKLNELITNTNQLTYDEKKANDRYALPALREIKVRNDKLLFEKFTAQIIVNKMRGQTEQAKKTYLKQILESANDQPEIQDLLERKIINYSNMTEEELAVAINQIDEETNESRIEQITIRMIFEEEKKRNSFLNQKISIDDSGKIFIEIKSVREMKNEAMREKIFAQQFFSNLSDKQKAHFEKKVIDLICGSGNKAFKFEESDTLKQRLELMAAVKNVAKNHGYVVLNALSEVENVDEVSISTVKNGANLDFSDIKRVAEKFKVEQDKDGQMTVTNRTTGETVQDISIESIARFADIWVKSAGLNSETNYYENQTMRYAFNEGSEETFYAIKNLIVNDMEESGNIDTKKIYEKMDELKYCHAFEIAESLLANKENYMTVYGFFRKYVKQPKKEIELPILFDEINESWKLEYDNIDYRVEQIMGKFTNQRPNASDFETCIDLKYYLFDKNFANELRGQNKSKYEEKQ